MTITLYWWLIPLGLIVSGLLIAIILKPHGDYDFGTPLLQAAAFFGGIFLALAFVAGRYFGK